MFVFRLSIVLSAVCLHGCCLFDFNIDTKALNELACSSALDVATWSARSIPDVNHDGMRDVLLRSSMPAGSDDAARMWILSGRDLTPLMCIAPDSRSHDRGILSGELATADETEQRGMAFCTVALRGPSVATGFETGSPVEPDWFTLGPDGSPLPFHGSVNADIFVAFGEGPGMHSLIRLALIEPNTEDWVTTDTKPEDSPLPFLQATSPNERVAAQYPGIKYLQLCGDVDDDGVLDWLGLTTHPFGIVVISGRDSSAIQSITLDAKQLATVATAGIEMGDVDGDGVSDWLVGAHASESTDHVAERTCRLGVVSLVSGADMHVIRTLERKSFLAGPGLQCPVVHLPD